MEINYNITQKEKKMTDSKSHQVDQLLFECCNACVVRFDIEMNASNNAGTTNGALHSLRIS